MAVLQLRDENFANAAFFPFDVVFSKLRRIPVPALFRSEFLVEQLQSLATEDPAIWKDNRIIFHGAGSVMGIGHVLGKLIELCRTDRADRCSSIRGHGESVLRVTSRSLECAEACRQSDV